MRSARRDDSLDVQPGALWGDVARAALSRTSHAAGHGRCADAVGRGTLSVGGIGETSYREGCQVDHVSELDVVTATGDHVTCSPDRNAELFRMMLAGLGQCGIIVRARLRLLRAPGYVVLRTLDYPDLQTLVSDQGRLASAEGLGPLTSRIVKGAGRTGALSIDRRKLFRGWRRHGPLASVDGGLRHISELLPFASPIGVIWIGARPRNRRASPRSSAARRTLRLPLCCRTHRSCRS